MDTDLSINKRLDEMPEVYHSNYQTAMSGKSRAAAVKAKCLDCCCWDRKQITNCPVVICSLWPYRPYRRPNTTKSPS